MGDFTSITIWVLASVCISLMAGMFIGRAMHQGEERRHTDRERVAALGTLVELLQLVERLTNDVGDRSTEMREVSRHVGEIETSGELEVVRQVLIKQVAKVLESNQRLEEDLQFARCRMEQQAEEIDRTRREAHTDALSGVFNRKAFDDKLCLLLGMFKREGSPFSLIIMDLDHFKWINDTYGHQAGDAVLRELGASLARWAREGDFVARYGGDEFVVLLPRTDQTTARQLARRLHGEVTRGNFGVRRKTEQTALTVSVGVATVCEGDTAETIFRRADEALYRSKRGGRNQVRFAEYAGSELASQAEAPSATTQPAPPQGPAPLQMALDDSAATFSIETGAGA